jgi:phage-related protein (TIGR01555 family)
MTKPTGKPRGRPAKTVAAVKQDGYANALSGTGTRRDRSTATYKSLPTLINRVEATSLYMDGMARRVVDVPAEEMTRAGFDLEEMDEALQALVKAKFEELDGEKHLNDALIWSRTFGGAVMVLGLNDGGVLDTPLNEEGVKDFEFMRVYDRYQATIRSRNLDVTSREYGQPEFWLISPYHGGNPYVVHNSRVIVFDGESIPDLLRQTNDGWGASVYQGCLDELKRLGTSHQWANSLLERVQQAVHKIPNLGATLRAPGGEALIQQRVDVVDMVRGILNTIVIDGEEDYSIISNTFSGVPDILDRFAEMLSAVTGIPVYLLMGRSPGGLNATGASNEEAWYARVNAMQNDILRKPIDRIVKLILIAMGKDGGEYKICFNPLKVPSDKEKAEIEKLEAEAEKIEAETAQIYVTINALDPGEVRIKIAEDYDIADPKPLPEPEPDDATVIAGE